MNAPFGGGACTALRVGVSRDGRLRPGMVLDEQAGVGVGGHLFAGVLPPVVAVEGCGLAAGAEVVDEGLLHLLAGVLAEPQPRAVPRLAGVGDAVEEELPVIRE